MLNYQIISPHISPIQTYQTVQDALTVMEAQNMHQIPVVENGLYKGLLAQDALLDTNALELIQTLLQAYPPLSVKAEDHLIKAVKLVTNYGLEIIPVVDPENNYVGAITANELFKHFAKISGVDEDGGLIVVETNAYQYSLGEISRLVENNNAHITQLNTYTNPLTGVITATIRINKKEVSDVVATLQRYEYSIAYFFGKEDYENELQHNYRHLINYLEI